MKKRMLSIGLTAALALGTLAGCGSGSATPASSGTQETSSAQKSGDSTEEVTLTLIHDLNEENSISFMEQAIALLEGKTVEKTLDSGCKLITRDNMYEEENQRLLYPFSGQ